MGMFLEQMCLISTKKCETTWFLCVWNSFRQFLRVKGVAEGNGNAKIVYEKYCCIVPWDTVHAAKQKRYYFFSTWKCQYPVSPIPHVQRKGKRGLRRKARKNGKSTTALETVLRKRGKSSLCHLFLFWELIVGMAHVFLSFRSFASIGILTQTWAYGHNMYTPSFLLNKLYFRAWESFILTAG